MVRLCYGNLQGQAYGSYQLKTQSLLDGDLSDVYVTYVRLSVTAVRSAQSGCQMEESGEDGLISRMSSEDMYQVREDVYRVREDVYRVREDRVQRARGRVGGPVEPLLTGLAPAGVVFVQIVLQRVPSAADAHHYVVTQHLSRRFRFRSTALQSAKAGSQRSPRFTGVTEVTTGHRGHHRLQRSQRGTAGHGSPRVTDVITGCRGHHGSPWVTEVTTGHCGSHRTPRVTAG